MNNEKWVWPCQRGVGLPLCMGVDLDLLIDFFVLSFPLAPRIDHVQTHLQSW